MNRLFLLALVACLGMTTRTSLADQDQRVIAPIDQRFANDQSDESPDFQRHVVPLLSRLGCSGRACHGSFQGRGGFQLSLFGYDFEADHQQLMDPETGRVDVDDVAESLMLAKPSDADMHEGGKRFELGSWQHRVLRRWVQDGAKFDADGVMPLVKLEILPAEIRFAIGSDGERETTQLTAIAHWPGGIREDVTKLCRFSSNDDSIAEVDEDGLVRSGDKGDTHVVISYDNAVVTVPVIRPVAMPTEVSPTVENRIDRLVQQKLDKLGIQPSEVCTDAEFVRRASLDIVGVLPSAERVRAFLASDDLDKRTKLVDELLRSPGYSAWWATRLSDWTGNSEEQLNNVLPVRNIASKLWYEWLRERLEQNVPYDEIIEGIVTANSMEGDETYLQYCETMTKACQGDESIFAERSGMPLFWSRKNFQKPEERAIGFAYTFLGVRIECAQCHKHPFDQWSKQDFENFSDLFKPIRAGNSGLVSAANKKEQKSMVAAIVGDRDLKGGKLRRAVSDAAREGEVVPFGEILINVQTLSDAAKKRRDRAIAKGRKVPALRIPNGKILGESQDLQLDEDPRPALMDWLRDPSNPYFAKAIVNRVWSNYFGIGIVNPTDDMNLANPPSNEALLNDLAMRFVENEFDLQWLHREILASDTYQRSATTNATNRLDRVNFSRHIPRRMPAEVVYDMVVLATGSNEKADLMRRDVDQMAIAEAKPRLRNKVDFALQVFGQSIRETNCDCDRSDEPSLLQSIYLRNDAEMYRRIADQNGWVAEACRSLGVDEPVDQDVRRKQTSMKAAEEMRKQAITILRRFERADMSRRKEMLPRIKKNYARLKSHLDGFVVPPLKSLMQDPESWGKLERERPGRNRTAGANQSDLATLGDVVQEAYLRTLSRFPEEEEIEIAKQYIEESEQVSDGIEGLLWALVNTKEFIISH